MTGTPNRDVREMNHEHYPPARRFPPGTPVCVRQTIERRVAAKRGTEKRSIGKTGLSATVAEVIGVVQSWEQRPTGSWYAHGKEDRLWLQRLKIKKADGELVLLIVDDGTAIAKLESAPASGTSVSGTSGSGGA